MLPVINDDVHEAPSVQQQRDRLRRQEVALLERQRSEYARMARKLERLGAPSGEKAVVERRLTDLDAELAKHHHHHHHHHRTSSKVWRRRERPLYERTAPGSLATPATESSLSTGESVLRKYSVTASMRTPDFSPLARHREQPSAQPPAPSGAEILSKYSARHQATTTRVSRSSNKRQRQPEEPPGEPPGQQDPKRLASLADL